MGQIVQFAALFYIIQLAHSLEELITGFHKKWYLFKIPFSLFFTFGVFHSLFWGLVLIQNQFPFRTQLLAIFILLMFVNGIQHLIWFATVKKYVPGLLTAPAFVVLFFIFYYQILTSQ